MYSLLLRFLANTILFAIYFITGSICLMRFLANATFSKSQKLHKARTLCIFLNKVKIPLNKNSWTDFEAKFAADFKAGFGANIGASFGGRFEGWFVGMLEACLGLVRGAVWEPLW